MSTFAHIHYMRFIYFAHQWFSVYGSLAKHEKIWRDYYLVGPWGSCTLLPIKVQGIAACEAQTFFTARTAAGQDHNNFLVSQMTRHSVSKLVEAGCGYE